MNICRLILFVGLAALVAGQETPKCLDDDKDIPEEDIVTCEGCTNCCEKHGVCKLLDAADEAAVRSTLQSYNPQFSAPTFGSGGMHALYSGNYLAQQALLAQCARETFPYVCERKQMYDYSYKCPLNIPYCQRIPCSAEDHKLETDPRRCLSKPGCCFDQTLALHRKYYRDAILPGVPVCHLAVRNKYFQKEAHEFSQKNRGWNPILTSCLIDSFKDYIYMNKRSCDSIKALEYFGFKAKLAGWKNITESECFLIGGCWRGHLNRCNYEPKSTKLAIRSAQGIPLPKKWTPQQIYGQPQCLELDYSMEGKEFLTSLHYCLASGCSLDPSLSLSVIHHYMQNVSAHLPGNMANLFRHEFNSGLIGPDNFNTQINYYQTNPHAIQQQNTYTSNYLNNLGNKWYSNYYSLPTSQGKYGGYGPILVQENQNPYPTMPHYIRRGLGDDEKAEEKTWNYGSNVDNTQVPPHPHYPFPTRHSGYGYGQLGQSIYGQSSLHNYYYRNYCPFRRPHVRGFPPLQGRFDGCCERPLCYMNRETVTKQFSGAANYFRPWSAWGPCSVTCGKGTQTRQRLCIGVAKCEGKATEQKECQGYYQCPKGNWKNWGKWSSCGKGCTNPVRMRHRVCQVNHWCAGPSTQTQKCRC